MNKVAGQFNLVFIRESVLVVLSVGLFMAGCHQEPYSIEEDVEKINRLVSIGMDLDEATEILKENGFRVGEKYRPTRAGNYYQVNIPLRDNMPQSESARYATGMESKEKMYVVIKSDMSGRIRSIE